MIADVVVIGAGMVGSAIAYGLSGSGVNVLVLDGNDRDFRSASANFGLVWLHGKGMDMPAYQRLTRNSVDLWAEFDTRLTETTDIDLQYEKKGGLVLCLGEAEFERRRATLQRLHEQLGGEECDWEMIDRSEVAMLFPKMRLGDEVTGASFGRVDGQANPLRLLSALHAGILRKGGRLHGGRPVDSIQFERPGRFSIGFGNKRVCAARVVIAAGLGTKSLAAQVGLKVPIRPQRGQILVTERLEPMLPLPTVDIRQTYEGTVMIGSTHEEVGLDTAATVEAASAMSARAIRQFPALGQARLVRQWGGLRILTPDGYPIYAESPSCPGAFIALCHSGVTLAPIHAGPLAEAIGEGRLPKSFDVFHQRRFDVSQAA